MRAVKTLEEGMKKMNGRSVKTRGSRFCSSLRNHPSDFDMCVACKIVPRKETLIKAKPSLHGNWKESQIPGVLKQSTGVTSSAV